MQLFTSIIFIRIDCIKNNINLNYVISGNLLSRVIKFHSTVGNIESEDRKYW